MLEQFVKNCSLWEGLTLEKFMEDCLLWEGPHTGTGGGPKDAVTPWEARAGAGSWQDLRTRGPVERGAHTEAGLLAGLVTPWGTHAGAVCS